MRKQLAQYSCCYFVEMPCGIVLISVANIIAGLASVALAIVDVVLLQHDQVDKNIPAMPKEYLIIELSINFLGVVPIIMNVMWLCKNVSWTRTLLKVSLLIQYLVSVGTLVTQVKEREWQQEHKLHLTGLPVAPTIVLISIYFVLLFYWSVVI